MTYAVSLRDFTIGVEGLAILRSWPDNPAAVEERMEELRTLLRSESIAEIVEVKEMDAVSGYEEISVGYDENAALRNPVTLTEQPVLFDVLGTLPPGRALDAACGTGRWTSWLSSKGHSVVGIDQSKAMLEIARAKVPGADFHEGQMDDLPFDDESFDLVLCTLALTHLPELTEAITQFARVLKPGGRLVTSDVHPFFTSLGLHAFYRPTPGVHAFVRNYHHSVSSYVSLLTASGLLIKGCWEPVWSQETALLVGAATTMTKAVTEGLMGLPLVLVWEAIKV